jgi:hypothetical protein
MKTWFFGHGEALPGSGPFRKTAQNLNERGQDPHPGLWSQSGGWAASTPHTIYEPKNREAVSDYPPCDLRAKIFRPPASNPRP